MTSPGLSSTPKRPWSDDEETFTNYISPDDEITKEWTPQDLLELRGYEIQPKHIEVDLTKITLLLLNIICVVVLCYSFYLISGGQ